MASQPTDLQKIAQAAATEMSGKFDQLESDVDEKQQSLVDDLAEKYVEARNAVDEEIKAEQEKNKGLVDKAKDAIGGAIETILKLKDLFIGLLSKAASAFKEIVEGPDRLHLATSCRAVKQGFMNFASNILEHLKKGLPGLAVRSARQRHIVGAVSLILYALQVARDEARVRRRPTPDEPG